MSEAIVTLADGRRVKITGPNRETVVAQARAMNQQPQMGASQATAASLSAVPGLRSLTSSAESSFGGAFGQAAGTRFANNALKVAEQALSIPGRAVNMITAPPEAPLFRVPDVNLPSAQTIAAAARALPGSPAGIAERFRQIQAQQQAEESQLAEERPIATTLGQGAGDAATIIAGKSPIRRAQKASAAAARTGMPRVLPEIAIQRIPGVGKVVESARNLAPETARAIDAAFQSPIAKRFARTVGRSVETGLEGAAIAVLNDGDPVEVGMMGAAGQLAGSGALKLVTTSKGLLGLGIAAGTAAAGIQMMKSATPGGQDFILESIESGFSKVTFAVALGATAGLAGAGRIRGPLAKDFPLLGEFTTVPRASVLSILNDWRKEQERGITTTEQTLTHLAANPEAFSKDHLRRLERAMKIGKFSKTVESLAENDKAFKAIIDSPVRTPSVEQEEQKEELEKRLKELGM